VEREPTGVPFDGVPLEDEAAVEGPDLEELQIGAHVARQRSFASADKDRHGEELQLVDQAGRKGLPGEVGAADAEVVLGSGFESPDRFRLEVPFDTRPLARHRFQRLGEDNLVRGLPDVGEVSGRG